MDNTWPIKQTPMRSHPASQVGGQKVMVCYFQGILETVFLSEGTDSLPVNLPKSMYTQLHVTSSFLGWYLMGPLKLQLATMHGQSSLVGYSHGVAKSQTQLSHNTHTHVATILRLILWTRHLQTHHPLNLQNCLREVGRQTAPQRKLSPQQLVNWKENDETFLVRWVPSNQENKASLPCSASKFCLVDEKMKRK